VIEPPSDRMPGKAPGWDLTGKEGCGGGQVVSWLPLEIFRVYKYIYEDDLGQEATDGPTRLGRALPH